MTIVLSGSIQIGIVLLLWMPMVVTTETLFPFVVGKALYARGLIEVITALWVVLILWDSRYRPPRSWILLAFAIYVLVAFLSALLGVNFTHSMWSDYQRMVGVWDLAHWFLLALVATSVLHSPGAWRSLLNWNLVIALTLSLLALAQAYQIRVLPYLLSTCRLDATVGNASYLAAILVIAVLVAAGFLARSLLATQEERWGRPYHQGNQSGCWTRSGMRLFWAAIVVLGLWVLLQTGTRGAIVGLLAGVVVMPVALGIWGDRRALRAVVLASGGILLTGALLFALDQTVGFPGRSDCREQMTSTRVIHTSIKEENVAVRIELARVGFRAFLERPLLGWGQDNFARIWDRFSEASLYKYGTASHDQAHNKLVEELATKGALGTLSYLALWVTLLWVLVRQRRTASEDALAYALLGALAAYFVQNLVLFDTPPMLLQWTLLVAWVAGQERTVGSFSQEARIA